MQKSKSKRGTTATTYEDHKSSILSLPEEVVLRNLPNGVCDTLNLSTGEYTQRIGEVVLDGNDMIMSYIGETTDVLMNTSRCYVDYSTISEANMKKWEVPLPLQRTLFATRYL